MTAVRESIVSRRISIWPDVSRGLRRARGHDEDVRRLDVAVNDTSHARIKSVGDWKPGQEVTESSRGRGAGQRSHSRSDRAMKCGPSLVSIRRACRCRKVQRGRSACSRGNASATLSLGYSGRIQRDLRRARVLGDDSDAHAALPSCTRPVMGGRCGDQKGRGYRALHPRAKCWCWGWMLDFCGDSASLSSRGARQARAPSSTSAVCRYSIASRCADIRGRARRVLKPATWSNELPDGLNPPMNPEAGTVPGVVGKNAKASTCVALYVSGDRRRRSEDTTAGPMRSSEARPQTVCPWIR